MKKIVAALLILLIVGCICPVVYAADWVEICNDDKYIISYDKETVQKSGNYYTVWVRWEYKKPESYLKNPYYEILHEAPVYKKLTCSKEQDAFTLDGKKTQTIYNVSYYDDGSYNTTVSTSEVKEKNWKSVIPDSYGEDIAKATKPQGFLGCNAGFAGFGLFFLCLPVFLRRRKTNSKNNSTEC